MDRREPPIDELLDDPMTRALMKVDRVKRRDIEALLRRKREDWLRASRERESRRFPTA
jgi:hypothetical protein